MNDKNIGQIAGMDIPGLMHIAEPEPRPMGRIRACIFVFRTILRALRSFQ